jgi:hypothetical protein
VALARSFVDVKSLEAQGGSFHILGRYHAAQGKKDGAFLIDAGPLALGVGIGGGKSEIVLAGPRTWFREQSAGQVAASPLDKSRQAGGPDPEARGLRQ